MLHTAAAWTHNPQSKRITAWATVFPRDSFNLLDEYTRTEKILEKKTKDSRSLSARTARAAVSQLAVGPESILACSPPAMSW